MRAVGLTCLMIVGVMLVGLSTGQAGPSGSSLLRWNGDQLEYFDYLGEGGWIPARVNNGVVECQSGSSWYPAYGVTPADVPAKPSGGSSSSSSTYSDAAIRRYQAVRTATETAGDILDDALYSVPDDSGVGFCERCCGKECADLVRCLGCPGCVYNADAGIVAIWDLHLGLAGSFTETQLDVLEAFTGGAEDRRIWSSRLYGALVRDRLRLLGSLRVEQFEGDGLADTLDGRRLALQLTPVYRLLTQQDGFVDLDLITALGLARTSYEREVADSDTEDEVTAGVGVALARRTPIGALRTGYIYQPTWNISGEDQLTGSNRIDVHAVSSAMTVNLLHDLIATVSAAWYYTDGLPGELDRDYLDGTVGLTYRRGQWFVGTSVGRAFYSDDFHEWHASLQGGTTW